MLLCRLVGVSVDASQADIKSAYRKAALKLHPDVNNAADATEKFAQLSSAYGGCLIPDCSTCRHCTAQSLASLRHQLIHSTKTDNVAAM